MYAALLADTKRSTSYRSDDRLRLQNDIEHTMYCLNRMYGPNIVKKVDFSEGDAVQGLFENPIGAYLYYRLFSFVLGVGKFRCGIGVGKWETRLEDRDDSNAQDGEAYHLARRAIDDAKGRSNYDLVCHCRYNMGSVLTVLLDHSWGICKMRTDSQNEVALVSEMLYPLLPEVFQNTWDEREWMSGVEELLEIHARRKRTPDKRRPLSASILMSGHLRSAHVKPNPIIADMPLFSGRRDSLYGAAREIASIAGISYQGVGRRISQGRLIQERNAIRNLALMLERGDLKCI